MFVVRALLYLVACAYLLAVLPGAGEAFAGSAVGLVAAARAGQAVPRAFLAGVALFLPLAWLLRSALRFWYTLAHELTHSLSAVLLGGRPGEMLVAASGEGEVRFDRAPAVVWLVLLAPYVVNPSYLVPLAVPLLNARVAVAGAAVAGLATAFALVSNGLQVRAFQSDIRRAGLVRSLLFIAWGNLVACALALALVGDEAGAVRAVLARSFLPPLP